MLFCNKFSNYHLSAVDATDSGGAMANLQSLLSGGSEKAERTLSIVNILFTTLFASFFEQFAKFLADKFHKNKQIKASHEAIKKSANSLLNNKKNEQFFFTDQIGTNYELIVSKLQALLSYLTGDESIIKSMSCLFLGPPGLGKTSLFYLLVQLAEEISLKNSKMKIVEVLSDNARERSHQGRKMALDKQLIKIRFIPGAFFLQYGDAKLAVFEDFIENIKKDLKDGHLVFLCIDEIDGMFYAGKDKRHSLGNMFIFGFDELKNFLNTSDCAGTLVFLGSANKSDLDYGMIRRVSDDIIVFNYPESNDQFTILDRKFNEFLKKLNEPTRKMNEESKKRLEFDMKILMTIAKDDIKIFNKFGIDFSGAEALNITNNFFIALTQLSNEKILLYGNDLSAQVTNLLKFIMLKEALKILKVRQHKIASETQDILDKLWSAMNFTAKLPKLDAGKDWNAY
jgi:hypothetical protein